MADAKDRAEVRNGCLPIESDDVLRFRGERASYETRYYYQGLRRGPVYVFTSSSFELHVLNDEVKAILPDGEDTFCEIVGKDERDAIALSER